MNANEWPPAAPDGTDPTTWRDLWRLRLDPDPYSGEDGLRLAQQAVTVLLELDADPALPEDLVPLREGLRVGLLNAGVLPGGPP